MRTSPTNLGLQLLATVSAYDLGLLTLDEMASRLELALRSLERMARFRGHFYNWYDLHDLRVLEPAYISTVDSGNLAGHLIALRQACLATIDEPVLDARLWRALTAALALAQERVQLPAVLPAAVRAGAAAELHTAQAAVARLASVSTRAGHLPPPRDARPERVQIEEIVRHLRRARALIAEPPEVPEARALTLEWIDWSLALLEADASLVERLRPPGAADSERAAFALVTLRQLAAESPDAAQLVVRLEALAERAYAYAMEMDFRFLFDESRELFSIGYQTRTHTLRSVVLRPAGLRGPAGQLRRHRQERRAGGTLVPPRAHADPRRGRDVAGVVEREHVRVPDARAGDAVVPVHAARRRPTAARCGGRSRTARSAACRGG